ncbi:MAG TPA: hypothetical protein VGO56_19810 [Pyrinomonadaceae bacterium]|nr:hypothetical protein [Pyrinomonadaceae bacterium]
MALAIITIVPFNSRSQTTGPLDRQTPLALAPGAPAGSRIEDFAKVNLFNGNLNFAQPLATTSGRGEIEAQVMLTLERHWQIQIRCDVSITGQLVCRKYVASMWWGDQQVGYGPGIVLGRGANTYPSGACTANGGVVFTFTDSTGTEHDLRDSLTKGTPHTGGACGFLRGTNFTSVDGTSTTFVSDSVINDDWANGPDPAKPTGYLLFANGSRYRVENGLVKWIRDRNGNKVSYSYEQYTGNASRVRTVTDTLGRIITINYDVNDATYGLCDQIIVPGFGATSRTVSVTKTPLSAALRYDFTQTQTYGQLFPEVDGLNSGVQFNPTVVSGVYLPNGRSYKFSYNPYGELARIQIPAGGAIDYDYLGGLTNAPNSGAIIGASYVYRRVVAKRVFLSASNPGSTSRTTSYSRPESWNSGSNSAVSVGYVSTDDRAADNSFLAYEKHYFYGASANSLISPNPYPAWKEGKEYQTEVFDTDRTTVLRRSIKNWQQKAPVPWWLNYAAVMHLNANDEPANDPRVVEVTDTIEPSGANLVSKISAINPQNSTVGFDQHNNQTDVWQYDYGVGAPPAFARRHGHTDYLGLNTANNINYANPVNGTSYGANDVHLRNLVRAQQLYSIDPTNGTETLVSQAEILYDEPAYPTVPYGTVTSWIDPGSARGNATSMRNWADMSGTWVTTHTQYDQCGNVCKLWDGADVGLTNPSQVSYLDSFSDGVIRNTYAFPTSVTSAVPDPGNTYGSNVAFVTTKVFDFGTGLTVSRSDANAKTTSYDYTDPLNRLKQVTLPDGGRIKYTYVDSHQCGPYMEPRPCLIPPGEKPILTNSSMDSADRHAT